MFIVFLNYGNFVLDFALRTNDFDNFKFSFFRNVFIVSILWKKKKVSRRILIRYDVDVNIAPIYYSGTYIFIYALRVQNDRYTGKR